MFYRDLHLSQCVEIMWNPTPRYRGYLYGSFVRYRRNTGVDEASASKDTDIDGCVWI